MSNQQTAPKAKARNNLTIAAGLILWNGLIDHIDHIFSN
jgi:hypothetical protein